jgi:hypothetical protein
LDGPFLYPPGSDEPLGISEQLQAIPQIYKSSRVTKVLVESPICRDWPKIAARVRLSPYFDLDVFSEEEIRHSRKCPNMVFLDTWFERLWTRQEGLYGMHIEMVILNWVDCSRLKKHISDMARWVAAGHSELRQQYAKEFIRDKLAYHGLGRDGNEFNCYFQLIYNLDLNIADYGGGFGPSPQYLPFTAAWRSARLTTKARDYVLAVMPDVEGYTVPENAGQCSFETLLADALNQFTRDPAKLAVISKVPKGMMETSDRASHRPWIINKPFNITEAYDTFLVMPKAKDTHNLEGDRKVRVVHWCNELETINFSRNEFQELLQLWDLTGNFDYQISSLPLNGPCVGYSRNIQTVEQLLHREFGHAFTKPVVTHRPDLRAHGVVDLNTLDISDSVFSRELKLFLLCFICSVTLETARHVFKEVEFRYFPSPFGKLIGLIKRDVLATVEEKGLALVTSCWSLSQGLQIAVVSRDKRKCRIVAKTQVPKGIEHGSRITGSGDYLVVEGT